MSTKATVVLAFVAGMAGGIASQRITVRPVYAQGPTSAPSEIRAEKFVIVDDNGLPRGAFGISTKNGPTLEVTDKHGHAWQVRLYGTSFFGNGKPSVVPPK